MIVERLLSTKPGYPGLDLKGFLYVRDKIFNAPNAPVSYPFLWDISHSDYLQWNGLAPNAGPGPLGRNTGEVIGVFGILDWGAEETSLLHPLAKFQKYSLSALLSGQKNKKHVIGFNSSIDLFNLYRLESRLRDLKSPEWPFCRNDKREYYLPEPQNGVVPSDPKYCPGGDKRFNEEQRYHGELIYIDRCQPCHTVIDRSAWDRIVVGHMSDVDRIGTDPAMAENSVKHNGKSGNFKDTYQATDAGPVIVKEDAPVVQILTAATKGVIATPDADKWWPRRFVEWVYSLVMSFGQHDQGERQGRGLQSGHDGATLCQSARLQGPLAERHLGDGAVSAQRLGTDALRSLAARQGSANIIQGRRPRVRSEQSWLQERRLRRQQIYDRHTAWQLQHRARKILFDHAGCRTRKSPRISSTRTPPRPIRTAP